jgi:Flp pilus assembly protein TadD
MDSVERYRSAEQLLADGNPHAALTVVEPLMDDEPDTVAVLVLAARASFDSARLERAEQLFRRVVELDPTHHYAHAGLGRTLQRRSRHREALPHLRLANALHPEPWYAQALARAEANVAEASVSSDAGQPDGGRGGTSPG